MKSVGVSVDIFFVGAVYIFTVAGLSCYEYRYYLVKICLGVLEWWLPQIKGMEMTLSEARNEPLNDERNCVCWDRDQEDWNMLVVKLN